MHPTDYRLNLFADHELSDRARARVARHLERCARCRNTVATIRTLGAVARELEKPRPAPYVRDRVLASVESGHESILPLADPTPVSWDRRFIWMPLGVVGVIAFLAAVFFRPDEAVSSGSSLTFSNPTPVFGETVEVTYRAIPALRDELRLHLRARFRGASAKNANESIPTRVVGILAPADDGSFHGSVRLPPEAVFAVFAVEDEEARVVDSRGRAGWELLSHQDGHPRFDALIQQILEAEKQDRIATLDAIIRLTELYPDRPEGWGMRASFETSVLGKSMPDSLRLAHRRQLSRLDSIWRGRPITGDGVFGMSGLAQPLGIPDVRDYWFDRLRREFPTHPTGFQLRALLRIRDHASDTVGTLAALERLWGEGARHPGVLQSSFAFARDAHRLRHMLRWAGRWIAAEPWRSPDIVARASTDATLSDPTVRDSAVVWLERIADSLSADPGTSNRPLYRTRSAHRGAVARTIGRVRGQLTHIYLASGDSAAARTTSELALQGVWSGETARSLTDLRLAMGDSSAAVQLLARLAVDPATSRDSIEHRALTLTDTQQWRQALTQARQALMEATRGEAEPRSLRTQVEVLDAFGERHNLQDLTGGQPSIVAFYSPRCARCVEDLRLLDAARARISFETGLVIISTYPVPSASHEEVAATGIDTEIMWDADGTAAQAFNFWYRVGYYVMGESGQVHYTLSAPEDVPRQLLTLAFDQARSRTPARAEGRLPR